MHCAICEPYLLLETISSDEEEPTIFVRECHVAGGIAVSGGRIHVHHQYSHRATPPTVSTHVIISSCQVLLDPHTFLISTTPYHVDIPIPSLQCHTRSIPRRLVAGLIQACSLWALHPNDTLACSSYLKIPLAESVIALAILWATYLTFFFAVFPVLSSSHGRVLYETFPCVVHVAFCWAVSLCWVLVAIYAHHRVQVVADSRRSGIWEILRADGSGSLTGSASGSGGGKVTAWKSAAQYHRGDVVSFSSRQYRLVSAHSSYHLPPSSSACSGPLLVLRERLLGLLSTESGPASRSTVLGGLLALILALCAVMAAIALAFPRQVRNIFLWTLALYVFACISLYLCV